MLEQKVTRTIEITVPEEVGLQLVAQLHEMVKLVEKERLDPKQLFCSVKEAGTILGCSQDKIRELIAQGVITSLKIDYHHRIPVLQFHEWSSDPSIPSRLLAQNGNGARHG